MGSSGPRRLRILLTGVVLALAGVVAVGLVALRRSADEAVRLARSEAERAATVRARQLRDRLESPGFLDETEAHRIFTIARGAVVVPPEIAWLDRPSPARPPETPPLSARLAERARRAEFEEDQPAAAEAWWDEALASTTAGSRLSACLALHAAWSAHRTGRPARRNRLRHRARDDGGILSGALPLFAAAGAPAPSGALRALRDVDDLESRVVLLRIREAWPGGAPEALATWRSLEENDRAVRRHRRLLRLVAPAVRALGPETSPGSFELAGGLLLHDLVRGRGAWIATDRLQERLRDEAGDAAPRIVPSGPEAGAVPIAAGIGIRPAVPQGRPSRLVLPGLLLALALVMVGGVIAVVRATWREAALARERAEFLTTVTHELKTPLASIRLLAEMLDQDRVQDADQAREYYRLLAGEAARLGTMVESVLDLGRLERGERAYDAREHDLRDLVDEAVEVFRPLAAQSGMALEVALPPEGLRCVADRGAVVQAMLNVMENARKYGTGPGGLIVSGARHRDRFEIALRDHGPGVPEAERETVFERFRRGRSQAAGEVPGLGLGLYLARTLVRDQGGELRLESPGDGPGARFVISLPLVTRTEAVTALTGGTTS